MSMQVLVNSVDVTKSVVRSSFSIEDVKDNQVNLCDFTLRKYGAKHINTPVVGNVVQVNKDGTKIFEGKIARLTQRAEAYKVVLFDVQCEDYTADTTRRLVADTFENQTVLSILTTLRDDYFADMTLNNVSGGDKVVSYIAFNYIPLSEAITELADLLNYSWYIDYDKDLHFISQSDEEAPIELNDDDGSYIFESLRIRRDNSQMRNRIFVRGGEYLANTFTTEFQSDGYQNIYTLPNKYEDIQVSVSSEVWDGGIDGIDQQSIHDYLWNKDEKFIRFRGDRVPSDGTHIRISGQPYYPVRVIYQDPSAIEQTASVEGSDGIYEYLIIDNSINTKEAARERAQAELASYAETISEGQFSTYTDGITSGQRIRINSDAHGIDEYFIINRVTARMRTESDLEYVVSLVTAKTMGIIEFLQKLLAKSTENIVINENEIIDLSYLYMEEATLSSEFTLAKEHNPVYETLTFDESVTEQALDYAVKFVVGPTVPNGTKRQFILDGSPLG